jgi:hypothetical protein
MSIFDQWLNTSIKRFKLAVSIYLVQLLLFAYGQFVVFYTMISITSSQDLLTLTNPRLRLAYWPMDLIATVMDRRISVLDLFDSLWVVLPIGFWISVVLVIYISSFKLAKHQPEYKHQQRVMILTCFVVVQLFFVNIMFLNGFFAKTVAIAINRVNISGIIGSSVAVVIGLAVLIIGSLLWIDLHDQND